VVTRPGFAGTTGHTTAMKTTIVTVGAVAATAAIGGVAADPGPPGIAVCASPGGSLRLGPRAGLDAAVCDHRLRSRQDAHTRPEPRSPPACDGLILDLALNAAWTPLFFRGRRPRAALAEIA
jgi:translocator protein